MTSPATSRPAISVPTQTKTLGNVRRHRTIIAWYLTLVGTTNFVLVFVAPERELPLRLALASALLWICSYPSLDYALKRPAQAAIFPTINGAYFVYFGLPVFLGTVELQGRVFDSRHLTTALALTLAGVVLMQVFFYSPIAKIVDLLPNPHIPYDCERLLNFSLLLATVTSLIAGYTYLGKTPLEIRALITALQRVPFFFLAAIEIVWLRRGLKPWQIVLWCACFAAILVCALGSGAVAHVMLALAPIFLVYVAIRGRAPWLAVCVAMALMVPFLQTKHAFRREVRERDLRGFERVPVFLEITWDSMTGNQAFIGDATETSTKRFSLLATYALVIQMTPASVPYYEGKSYESMVWSFVPRFIAPDKPYHISGVDFGQRYGFLGKNDFGTTVNLPQMVEMYMNYGYAGVFIGMALLGMYYRALYALFNHGHGDAVLMVGASTMVGLFNIESEAAAVLSGGVLLCSTGFALMWCAAWVGRYLPSSAA